MKVVYAVLPTGQQIFHPALHGALKGTITDRSYPGIKMSMHGSNVLIEYKTKAIVASLTRFEFVEIMDDVEGA